MNAAGSSPSPSGSAAPGARFRSALAAERPLQIVGTINAYYALLARRAGFQAIYLSGAGVANASYGMPDLGMTSLDNVLEDVRRITGVCDLPLLVDADTGWGGALNIARTVREMQRAGAAAVHLEDQVSMKRCGHRPGKAVVPPEEMVDRIKSAADGRSDPSFVLMARTDAAAAEGLDAAIERSLRYVEAGADMIFAEALGSVEEYRAFCSRVRVPVLANLTEFGKTPLLSRAQLAEAGVAMALYPLGAFRAMSRAAVDAYAAIRDDRQAEMLPRMQTRDELYDVLGYHEFERRIDRILRGKQSQATRERMMAEAGKPIGGAGLRGQSAGETALCTVGKAHAGLTYRGYDVAVLAEKAGFEEVAHLLLRGRLPNRSQLADFTGELMRSRGLPAPLREMLERLPRDSHPMDVLRSGCSALGSFEPEADFSQQQRLAVRLLGAMPSMLLYWYRFTRDGTRIEVETDDDSVAGHFLRLLRGAPPADRDRRVLDVSLILYAEHEFNASTFAARVCASTLSDLYSCVTTAIGTLRGPLHGGANEKAMALLDGWRTPDEAEAGILRMLSAKEKIMGFGHAIYRESDPRSAIIQRHADELSRGDAARENLYATAKRVAEVMWREKKLFPNADFFHAPAYRFLGIPVELSTPIFACSRVSGWCAHVMEQRANNRIIRPSADYIGPASAEWVDIDQRL